MARRDQHIIIVGAGLCGGLLALRLAQYGYRVSLVEKRGDMRKMEVESGRSINLALSDRGLKALRLVGLEDKMRTACIPMKGRMIHGLDGTLRFSPYSGRPGDYINSVSRSDLNRVLIEEADVHDHVRLYFDAKCTAIDFDKSEVHYQQNGETGVLHGDVIIGTDGAGSVVRRELMRVITSDEEREDTQFLSHGYKELSIPPSRSGGWKIEKNALHIWPRGTFMLIALPNLDGSFTVTLFLSNHGEISFDSLDSDEKVISFFNEYFPDTLYAMPDLVQDFNSNPVGRLGTLKCYPWHYKDKCLLMGDAAHAIVPFYGQGMNASFEDVTILDEILSKDEEWLSVFEKYQSQRKENTDAIADLALDNFYEMRDHVDDEAFVQKRKIETQLEQQFPSYYSKYSMVTFNENMPYASAMKKGRKQDDLLLELCSTGRAENMKLLEILKFLEENVEA